MKVIVFDTETTGLPLGRNPPIEDTSKFPYIIQLSYILYDTDTNALLNLRDDIINIPNDVIISKESTNIHGITRTICNRKGINLDKAIDDFNEQLNIADIIVGHNVAFDKRMILVESIRLNKEQYFTKQECKKKEFCTMMKCVKLCGIVKTSIVGEKYYKFPTLSELYTKLFNKIPIGVHDSIVDVLICLRCYMFVNYNVDVLKIGCNNIKRIYKVFSM